MAVVINPTAGRGRAGKAIGDIKRRLFDAGISATYYFTQGRNDAEQLARSAIAGGATVVVAAGGDGTLHEVTNAVMAAPAGTVALGLLPFGTGNDFARGVGLFGNRDAAFDAIVNGQVTPVDIGNIESPSLKGGRWFLAAAGIGFVADIAATVNEGIRFLHGAPAYIYGAAKTLRHMAPFDLVLTIDDVAHSVSNATLVSVSNVETTGGGLKIAPNASAQDGFLDVCLVGQIGKMDLLRQLPAVAAGQHTKHPAVTMLRGRRVVIETTESKALWIDGEVIGQTPATFTVHPGALPMLLPRPSNANESI